MTSPHQSFLDDCAREIAAQGEDPKLRALTRDWFIAANAAKYSYHFSWLGRPIIQYPQDIAAFQELVWQVQPDVIIETGIAHGGSLILSASLLAMLDLCEATENGEMLDPARPKRKVIGVDIDIRKHNREAIEAHPMAKRITMFEGSSVDPAILAQVLAAVGDAKRVLVSLDSNHTHEHVLAELHAYAPMVSKGSYCVVFDTVIEDLPDDMFKDRPWSRGDNAKTAVHEFLKGNAAFEIDKVIENKLLITVAPDGFLKRVS
jgi:cephalosporin hydroxylase